MVTKQELSQELKDLLTKNIVSFSYEKKNGEWREAVGTRNPKMITEHNGELPKGTGKEATGVITYWDIKAEAWRSFREDSIITINHIEG